MRAFDVRLVRLAVAAGAIVGSALVSSVAVATDESLPIEPSPTAPSDVASIDVEQNAADVIVIEPPPGAPFEDIAVIEIVMPEPEVVEPEAVEPEMRRARERGELGGRRRVDHESTSRGVAGTGGRAGRNRPREPSSRKNPVENTRVAPAVRAIRTG